MTTSQILSLVRAKILETSSEIITDATLLIYANFTKDDIVKRAFPNDQIESATITFTSGVGTLPTDFGTMYGDAFKNLGDYFPELSIDDFQKQTLNQAVTIEGGQIKVYPDTTASLTIKYYPTYPELTASVNPTFDTYFHEPIIYGILARVYEDLQDFELASANAVKYENILNQKIAVQSNYEENNCRSAQMFSEQDLLDGGTSFI
jgi:hypothetical protein